MIGIKWTGWDGSVWDLRTGPVRLTRTGVSALLGSFKYDDYVATTALRDGQVQTGWRAQARTVLLPVMIGQAATEAAWLALDRAWWRTMRPGRPGTVTVTSPDGTARTISLRFVDDGDMPYDHDPTADRLSVAAIAMVADDPWWIGAGFKKVFASGDDAGDFFGGDEHAGPPFYISSANSVGTQTVNNPGDEDAWPVYYIDGPCTAFEVTVGGQTIAGDIDLDDTQQLVIDTDPKVQLATLMTGGTVGADGIRVGGTAENATRQLSSVGFASLASGADVPVTVAVTGTGKLTLRGKPRYYRAW